MSEPTGGRMRVSAEEAMRRPEPSGLPCVLVRPPTTHAEPRRQAVTIAAVALGSVALVLATVGLGVSAALARDREPPTRQTPVRELTEAESRAIKQGSVALAAPTVEGRLGGLMSESWNGTSVPWRLARDGSLVLVTNAHVLHGAESARADITVRFASGQSRPARSVAVAADHGLDLGLIAVDASGLLEGTDFARMNPEHPDAWDDLSIGENVLAIGSPLGLPQTHTLGRISALRAGERFPSMSGRWIQVDATVLPGNSGGPLLSLRDGEWRWIGVVSALGPRGVGLAIFAGEIEGCEFKWTQGADPGIDRSPDPIRRR